MAQAEAVSCSKDISEVARDVQAALQALKPDAAHIEAAAKKFLEERKGRDKCIFQEQGMGKVTTTKTQMHLEVLILDGSGAETARFDGDAIGTFIPGTRRLNGVLYAGETSQLYAANIFYYSPGLTFIGFYTEEDQMVGFIINKQPVDTVLSAGSGKGDWSIPNN